MPVRRVRKRRDAETETSVGEEAGPDSKGFWTFLCCIVLLVVVLGVV